jgi:hypothetical protein
MLKGQADVRLHVTKITELVDVDETSILNQEFLQWNSGTGKWEGVAVTTDLSAAVILAPDSSTRNVIQPTTNAYIPFSIKGQAGQSTNLLEVKSSSDADLFHVTNVGGIHSLSNADISGYVSALTELRVLEDAGNGTSYVGFDAPASLAGNQIWTLPATDGSTGDTLSTNGSGVLSWITPAGPTTVWSRNTATPGEEFLYPVTSTDKIAVGASTSPATATMLAVTATVATRRGMVIVGAAAQSGDLLAIEDSAGASLLQFLPAGHLSVSREVRFRELPGSGVNYVGFISPDTLAGDQIWILPTADGTANQVLQTSGAGVLSWADNVTGVTDHGALTGLSDDDHTIYAHRTPTTSIRNVVQPSGNFIPLTLKGHSTQTLRLLQFVDSTDTDLAYFLPGGHFWLAREMRYGELSGNGTNYVGFKAADALGGNQIWTLPTTDGSNTQVLQTNGGGVLSWVNNATGVTDHGALTGLTPDDDHTQYVITSPGLSTRNSIQPSGDFIPLTLKGNAAQSENLFEIVTSADAELQKSIVGGHWWISRELRLAELVGNGPSYVGFKAPDSLAANQIWTLPLVDGSNTQVLQTNGSGVLSWANNVTGVTDHGALTGLDDDDHINIYTHLTPPDSTRNTIQPSGNFIPLVIKGHATQAVDLLNIVDSSDADLVRAIPGGHLWALREMRMGELAVNGTNYVGFKAPDLLAGDQIWELPAADGTVGQVLSTDGGGVITWADNDTLWARDTSPIAGVRPINSNDAVFIGVVAGTATAAKLYVQGNSGDGAAQPIAVVRAGNSMGADIPVLELQDFASNARQFAVFKDGDTLVGIGTMEATAKFEVQTTLQGSIPHPKMTTTQRDAISTPVEGLGIWNTTDNVPEWYDGTSWKAGSLGAATGFWTRDATNGTVYPTTTTDAISLWASGAGQVYLGRPSNSIFRIGKETAGTTNIGNFLEVVGPDSPNTPFVRFFTNTLQSNCWDLESDTGGAGGGPFKLTGFVAGSTGQFLPGTAAGDVGLTSFNGDFYIGKSGGATENYIHIKDGDVGIGIASAWADPSSKLDVNERIMVRTDGNDSPPDTGNQGGLTIVRTATNTAQYINLVRNATQDWSIGMRYNANQLAIGTSNATDVSWGPRLILDTDGKMVLGRDVAPDAGAIAEFYSDPSNPKAIWLPVINDATELGNIPTPKEGFLIYTPYDSDVKYYDNGAWKSIVGGGVSSPPLEFSTTWDPASIADGTLHLEDFVVTGAALGDIVSCSFSLTFPDYVFFVNPYVSATDTVTVGVWNQTGGAVDLGSGTLRISIREYS